jgi:HSP20 family protein
MFELLTRKNDLNPLFTDLFDDVWRTTENLSKNLGIDLPYNVKETEKDYTLEISLPGFEKSDLNIRVEDDLLTISHHNDKQTESFCWKHSFTKSFNLPKYVNTKKVAATLENGILNVVLPKVVEPKNVVEVKIK